jgi:outer membrane immunogenic protein
MKRLLLSSVLAAAFVAGPAVAADMPGRYPAPPRAAPVYETPFYNWTGFYIGANGGGAWGEKCWSFVGTVAVPIAPVNEGCHDPSGGVFGGQVGFNWQAGSWVFGLEAQGDWASLSGDAVSLAFPTLTNRSRVDALGLFTGRVGFAWSNVLAYAKGGGALARDRYDVLTTATRATVVTADETRGGWTVGAGVEFGFAPNWSAGVEYNYIGLSEQRITFVPGTSVDNIDQNIHMFTGRINYRFGGPIRAAY